MEKFVLIVSLLSLYSIYRVNGGAIPITDRGSSMRVRESSIGRNHLLEGRGGYYPTRRFDLPSGYSRRWRPTNRRDQLLDELRVELQKWHDNKRGTRGPPEVAGKSLFGAFSTMIGLITNLLPWFGYNPPKPMSEGKQMMSGGGSGGGGSGGGGGGGQIMLQGGGQMIMPGGGNFILVPIH